MMQMVEIVNSISPITTNNDEGSNTIEDQMTSINQSISDHRSTINEPHLATYADVIMERAIWCSVVDSIPKSADNRIRKLEDRCGCCCDGSAQHSANIPCDSRSNQSQYSGQPKVFHLPEPDVNMEMDRPTMVCRPTKSFTNWSVSSHSSGPISGSPYSISAGIFHRDSVSSLASSSTGAGKGQSSCLPQLLSGCSPMFHFRVMSRDRRSLLVDRKMSPVNRKQIYVIGAILIIVGLTSVVVNIVGIVIHAAWSFTAIGLWAGACNVISGWAAIYTAQRNRFSSLGGCLGGLSCCSAVCSLLQSSFGIVGITARDFYYGFEMNIPMGSTEVNISLVVLGLVAALLNLCLAGLSCRNAGITIKHSGTGKAIQRL